MPPEIGLGCAHLGNLFERVPTALALETVDAAWDAGIRYFDTAPWYGHGLSELRLGTALRDRPRDDYYLSTKVGRTYAVGAPGADNRGPWLDGLDMAVTYDYSSKGFERSVEQSVLRLGIARHDALVIHDLDRGHHGERFERHLDDLLSSGLPRLQAMQAEGAIGAIGMGMNDLSDFETLASRVDVDFFLVAMPYTLLDQRALRGPMRTCLERGIGVVIGAPFASGILATNDVAGTYGYGEAASDVRERAEAIARLCARHDVPLPAAALRFPRLHPAVRAIIPGATRPEHVRANVANASVAIPPALWHDLKSDGLIDPDAPTDDPS